MKALSVAAITANGLLARLFSVFTCAISPGFRNVTDDAHTQACRAIDAINNRLEKASIRSASEQAAARASFEDDWNRLNALRAANSIGALVTLSVAAIGIANEGSRRVDIVL